MSTLKYIIKRLILLIPVLIAIVTVIFTIMYFSPGSSARAILGEYASAEDVAALEKEMGLDQPYIVQLGNYILNLCKGDLGTSYILKMPVTDVLLKLRFPYTLKLALLGVSLAIMIGVPVGIVSASKQYTLVDSGITVFALILTSIPVFAIGLLLQIIFAGILPSSGYKRPIQWVLPVIAMGLANSATIIRMTRTTMLEVLRQDYIRTAKAKGASQKRVVFVHALKNAAVPVLTVIGNTLGTALAGAVVVEKVFSIPGLGTQLVTSIRQQDTPLILGSVLLISITYSIVNLLVDILYTVIDPRIKV